MKHKRKRLPKHLSYSIEPADIEGATACDWNCPHARALSRILDGCKVRVRGGRIFIAYGGRRYVYSAPTYTQKFEGTFDTNGVVTTGRARAIKVTDRAMVPAQPKTVEQKAAMTRPDTVNVARGLTPRPYSGRVFTVA